MKSGGPDEFEGMLVPNFFGKAFNAPKDAERFNCPGGFLLSKVFGFEAKKLYNALKVLSRQLKELVEDGIVHREVFPEVPPRVEYSLTEKGESLAPIMQGLSQWSRENVMEVEKA